MTTDEREEVWSAIDHENAARLSLLDGEDRAHIRHGYEAIRLVARGLEKQAFLFGFAHDPRELWGAAIEVLKISAKIHLQRTLR